MKTRVTNLMPTRLCVRCFEFTTMWHSSTKKKKNILCILWTTYIFWIFQNFLLHYHRQVIEFAISWKVTSTILREVVKVSEILLKSNCTLCSPWEGGTSQCDTRPNRWQDEHGWRALGWGLRNNLSSDTLTSWGGRGERCVIGEWG